MKLTAFMEQNYPLGKEHFSRKRKEGDDSNNGISDMSLKKSYQITPESTPMKQNHRHESKRKSSQKKNSKKNLENSLGLKKSLNFDDSRETDGVRLESENTYYKDSQYNHDGKRRDTIAEHSRESEGSHKHLKSLPFGSTSSIDFTKQRKFTDDDQNANNYLNRSSSSKDYLKRIEEEAQARLQQSINKMKYGDFGPINGIRKALDTSGYRDSPNESLGNPPSLNRSIDAIKHRVSDAKSFKSKDKSSIYKKNNNSKKRRNNLNTSSQPRKAFKKKNKIGTICENAGYGTKSARNFNFQSATKSSQLKKRGHSRTNSVATVKKESKREAKEEDLEFFRQLYQEGLIADEIKKLNALKERMAKETFELEQCTFKPELVSKPYSSRTSHLDFIDRQTVWQEKKKFREFERRQGMQKNDGIEECTFQPKTNLSSYAKKRFNSSRARGEIQADSSIYDRQMNWYQNVERKNEMAAKQIYKVLKNYFFNFLEKKI